jgi:hypothetical protein
MGKKRRIKAIRGKFKNKYSAHPRAKLLSANKAQVDTVEVSPIEEKIEKRVAPPIDENPAPQEVIAAKPESIKKKTAEPTTLKKKISAPKVEKRPKGHPLLEQKLQEKEKQAPELQKISTCLLFECHPR